MDSEYGKPEEIPEFENISVGYSDFQTQGFEELHTCTATDSCCRFGFTTYEHCGKYCGNYESAGGGSPINPVDGCCAIHDQCLIGMPVWESPCPCHNDLLDCLNTRSAPVDSIIAFGIRQRAKSDGCSV